jgi:hypothetical protein
MVVPSFDENGFLGDDFSSFYDLSAGLVSGRGYLAILFCFDIDWPIHYQKCGATFCGLVYLCLE